MLYKRNHWTRCAGFMDASWVHMGITDDDLGTSWSLPGDNLGMTRAYSGKTPAWHTLAYSGILWHTLAYSGILWHILAYSSILLHTLAYSGILLHSMHNQYIINDCWRSVRLPCGQYMAIFFVFLGKIPGLWLDYLVWPLSPARPCITLKKEWHSQ